MIGVGEAIGSSISATAGHLDTVLGSILQRRNDRRNMNRQREHNLEMWRLENEYNTPAAQMQRFRDAGLNPHLIYGQGTPGNASPVQPTDMRQSPVGLGSSIDGAMAFVNMRNAIAQNQLIQEQADATRALTSQRTAAEALSSVNRSLRSLQYQFDAQSYGVRQELLRRRNNIALQQAAYIDSRTRLNSLEQQLKTHYLGWARQGFTPADNYLLRQLGNWFNRNNTDLGQFMDSLTRPIIPAPRGRRN